MSYYFDFMQILSYKMQEKVIIVKRKINWLCKIRGNQIACLPDEDKAFILVRVKFPNDYVTNFSLCYWPYIWLWKCHFKVTNKAEEKAIHCIITLYLSRVSVLLLGGFLSFPYSCFLGFHHRDLLAQFLKRLRLFKVL